MQLYFTDLPKLLKDFDSYNPYCKTSFKLWIAYVLKYVCEEIEQEDKFMSLNYNEYGEP